MSLPGVGAIVHYVAKGAEAGDGKWRPGPCRAAIVTHVIEPDKIDPYVDLTVFEPNGWRVDGAVKNDVTRTVDETWHWAMPDC
ncbi:hypothetical protein [Streptomyces sp. NPDC005303]|uniref:hypothetical protein n=1 Tax=Streptomyces sp. NPDC005303 TaxID=3155713 RepID=UPI0033A22256